jgi:hypothetical protein
MLQEIEAGGNGEMRLHALPKLPWNAGYIKILSFKTIKQIRV